MLLVRIVSGKINGIVTVARGIVAVIIILILIIVPCFFKFFRHRWECNTLWKIWQWVDESSLLIGIMIEWAALTELALTGLGPELAWDRLVVGVHCTESSLAEVLWKWLRRKTKLDRIIRSLNLRHLVVWGHLLRGQTDNIVRVGTCFARANACRVEFCISASKYWTSLGFRRSCHSRTAVRGVSWLFLVDYRSSLVFPERRNLFPCSEISYQ